MKKSNITILLWITAVMAITYLYKEQSTIVIAVVILVILASLNVYFIEKKDK